MSKEKSFPTKVYEARQQAYSKFKGIAENFPSKAYTARQNVAAGYKNIKADIGHFKRTRPLERTVGYLGKNVGRGAKAIETGIIGQTAYALMGKNPEKAKLAPYIKETRGVLNQPTPNFRIDRKPPRTMKELGFTRLTETRRYPSTMQKVKGKAYSVKRNLAETFDRAIYEYYKRTGQAGK